MNFWIFTVTEHKVGSETFVADEILRQRVNDKFWGLGEKTPNRKSLQKGDQIVFYVGMPRKVFAASASLASDSFMLTPEQQSNFGHGKQFYHTDYGVLLENIKVWGLSRSVEEIVPNIKFIENKENWYAYFQGGVRQVSEDDYRTIVEGHLQRSSEKTLVSEDIESDAQFALEAHLEEFIDQNWNSITFDSQLERYVTDDQNGRQFPAGPWSVDFLCIDKKSGDFVVIELKRGKSSDSTVGQVLRYIGWVRENLAQAGQGVRGIIVAKEVDDALRYAVIGLENIAVFTYKVDFRLSMVKK